PAFLMDPIHSNYTNVRTRQIVTARSDFQHISQKVPGFFTQDSPRRRPPVFQPCQAEKAVAPRGAKWPRLLPFPAAARPKKFVLTKKHFLSLPFLRFDISSLQE